MGELRQADVGMKIITALKKLLKLVDMHQQRQDCTGMEDLHG